jgi:magnesium-transporting ATPase (P-type)
VAAVREGRTVHDNVVKVIAWTLPTNGGVVLTIIAAIALGLQLPITPLQTLWINMITAVALGLTLAFEPTEPGTMQRAPRPRGGSFLSAGLGWRIGFVSLLFVAGCFGIFWWAQARGLPLETARTLVVNTLVAMEVAYLFSVRFVHGSSLTLRGVLGTPAVLWGVGSIIVAQAAFTWLPPVQRLFHTTSITAGEVAAVLAIGAAVLLVAEAEKHLRRALAGARR